MNLDTAVSKLETIASRVSDPIHVGFESIFEGAPLGVLFTVKEIYVFGSAVYMDDPNDLDISVVTETADQTNWKTYCKEQHQRGYRQFYGSQRLVKKTLRRKMRNVDIHVDDFETIPTKLRILVWSRTNPNVKENFLAGREIVDLAPECRSLRKQLKVAEAKGYVLETLCRMYRYMENHIREWNHIPSRSDATQEELYEIRTLRMLNDFFRKVELPTLKLFFEEHGESTWDYTDRELIKKFIEIKEQKGSKRIFEELDYSEKERAHSKRAREFQRT